MADHHVKGGRIRAVSLLRHGHKRAGKASGEYSAWKHMRERCSRQKNASYSHYGGRGIKVCERWGDFVAFLEDMGKRPSPQHQLDRLDNNGNYEPSNCRWATPREQANNRRSNRIIEYGGERKTLAEWARASGLSRQILYWRLKTGKSIDEALSAPLQNHEGRL